jgi:beta-lactam-binding protein with PASTA domain
VGDYRCLDLATARQQIESIGLRVGTVFPSSPVSDDDWIVAEQNPQPGSAAPLSSDVDLFLIEPGSPCPLAAVVPGT